MFLIYCWKFHSVRMKKIFYFFHIMCLGEILIQSDLYHMQAIHFISKGGSTLCKNSKIELLLQTFKLHLAQIN